MCLAEAREVWNETKEGKGKKREERKKKGQTVRVVSEHSFSLFPDDPLVSKRDL